MNEDMLADLKQFITMTVRNEVRQEVQVLETKIDLIDRKLDSSVAAIGDAMEGISDSVDGVLANHESRIVRLEKRTA